MKNFSRLAVSALALALIAGCGGGSGGGTDNPGGGGTDPGGGGDGTASYTVKPSVSGSGGSISPDKAVSVQSGATTEFTVTPNSDYSIANVGGTCGGTLSGNTYTTKPVTANCTVVASFSKTAPAGPSIANCFTVPKTVKFAWASTVVPRGVYPVQTTVGPSTFDGQAVTESITTESDGTRTYVNTDYWALKSDGVYEVGKIYSDGTIFKPESPPLLFPINMKPGDSSTYDVVYNGKVVGTNRVTLIGFETLTLGGKTFTNTCHFLMEDAAGVGVSSELWNAYGYGEIQTVTPGLTAKYNGDL